MLQHRNNNNNKLISALQIYKIDFNNIFTVIKVMTKDTGSLKKLQS